MASFECVKPGVEPKQPITPHHGVSGWRGGGPGGAAWNASELRCEAVIRTTCAKGSVQAEMRVGRRVVATHQRALKGQKTVTWTKTLPSALWEPHLDAPGPVKPLYRTGVFRLMAWLECETPYEVHPGGLESYGNAAAWRAFVAGFAGGE